MKPRGLRRSNVRITTRKTLKKEIDIEKNFKFCPYSYMPRGVSALHFEGEGGTLKLTPGDKILKKVCFMLALVAPTLLSAQLETKESVTSYNPQQIVRQFAFDQKAVMIARDMSFSSIKILKPSYQQKGTTEFYLPFRHSSGQHEGELVSARQEEHFTG